MAAGDIPSGGLNRGITAPCGGSFPTAAQADVAHVLGQCPGDAISGRYKCELLADFEASAWENGDRGNEGSYLRW